MENGRFSPILHFHNQHKLVADHFVCDAGGINGRLLPPQTFSLKPSGGQVTVSMHQIEQTIQVSIVDTGRDCARAVAPC